jgi:hypothetical protein
MHTCSDCGRNLDEIEGHMMGVDACPDCDSTRVDATVNPGTAVVTVTPGEPKVVTINPAEDAETAQALNVRSADLARACL